MGLTFNIRFAIRTNDEWCGDGEEERKYLCKIEKSHNELVEHYYKYRWSCDDALKSNLNCKNVMK